MHQKELRALIARMQEQVTLAAGATPTDENKKNLESAWNSLNGHLAVGPAPDTKVCPTCKHEIMGAASLCGFCWTKLSQDTHA